MGTGDYDKNDEIIIDNEINISKKQSNHYYMKNIYYNYNIFV